MLVYPCKMINKEMASVYQKVKDPVLAFDKIPAQNLICCEVSLLAYSFSFLVYFAFTYCQLNKNIYYKKNMLFKCFSHSFSLQ